MSYNLKCCSFYPNNFDASALTPTEVHVYPDRGTMTLRYVFTLYSSFPEDFFSKARTYIPCASES